MNSFQIWDSAAFQGKLIGKNFGRVSGTLQEPLLAKGCPSHFADTCTILHEIQLTQQKKKQQKPAWFVGFKSQWWQQVTSHDLVYETQMSNASRSGTWNAWQSTPFSFCPIWTFSLGPYLTCAVNPTSLNNQTQKNQQKKAPLQVWHHVHATGFLTIADMRCGVMLAETTKLDKRGQPLKDPVFGSGKLDWSGPWVFSWWGVIFNSLPGLRDVARLIDYVGYVGSVDVFIYCLYWIGYIEFYWLYCLFYWFNWCCLVAWFVSMDFSARLAVHLLAGGFCHHEWLCRQGGRILVQAYLILGVFGKGMKWMKSLQGCAPVTIVFANGVTWSLKMDNWCFLPL